MNILEFSAPIGLGSLLAGFLGALTGLGGGALLVPFLTLALKVDMRDAIGASLISVMATSSGAAAAYVAEDQPRGTARGKWAWGFRCHHRERLIAAALPRR